jgi:hypothetical protein
MQNELIYSELKILDHTNVCVVFLLSIFSTITHGEQIQQDLLDESELRGPSFVARSLYNLLANNEPARHSRSSKNEKVSRSTSPHYLGQERYEQQSEKVFAHAKKVDHEQVQLV